MNGLTLQPGDFFCTKNPMALGKIILAIETFQSKDNSAKYSHSGIVTSPDASTVEALWHIGPGKLDAYKGENVIIGRWRGMTPEAFKKGLEAIRSEIGMDYPFWRLGLFLIPAAAKYISAGKFTVCSELACKFLLGAGFDAIGRWQGWNPDDVAHMIERDRDCDKIYEGVWEGLQK